MLLQLATRRLRDWVSRPWDWLAERRLARACPTWQRPHHLGFILDGNRRFARAHRLHSIVDGHAMGADKLHEVLRWCKDYGVSIATIWIFSLDNFQRASDEVEGLLALIERKSRDIMVDPDVHRDRIKVKYLGRLETLPASLQATIREVEAATAHYDQFLLNVAIAYGGREEISDAIQGYLRAQDAAGGTLASAAAACDTKTLDRYVYTAGLPDPDLIIRTSGELRLSGFLLWQAAYAEYYFCARYWPEFRRVDFLRALQSFDRRQRRYGK